MRGEKEDEQGKKVDDGRGWRGAGGGWDRQMGVT